MMRSFLSTVTKFSLFLLFFGFACLEAAELDSGKAQIRLDEWQVQPGVDLKQDLKDGEWMPVKLPLTWPGGRPPGSKALQGKVPWAGAGENVVYNNAWFQREVVVPEAARGCRVWFSLEGIECDARLKIDGKDAGELLGPDARLDVTAHVQPGRKSVFRLWVTRSWVGVSLTPENDLLRKAPLLGLTKNKNSIQRQGKSANIREQVEKDKIPLGISGMAWLQWRPAAGEITEVWVEPSYREKKLRVVAKVLGQKGFSGSVRVKVLGADGQPAQGETPPSGQIAVKAPQGGEQKLTLDMPWEKPRLWELGDGQLYTLQAELVDATGKVMEKYPPFRFGFREIWVDGRQIMMNGHPIRLRLASSWRPSWHSLPFFLGLGFNGAEFQPHPTSWFDKWSRRPALTWEENPGFSGPLPVSLRTVEAADEEGFALLLPAPGTSKIGNTILSPRGAAQYRRELKLWFGHLRNHPSVLMWTPSMNAGSSTRENPSRIGRATTPKQWVAAVNSLIKQEDPTRLVFHHAGDGGEVDYPNQYLNWMALQEREEFPSGWAKDGDVPWGVVEHGGMPICNDFSLLHGLPQYTEFCAIYFGDEAWRDEKDEYTQRVEATGPARGRHAAATFEYDDLNRLHDTTIYGKFDTLFNRNVNRAWRAFGVPGGWIPWFWKSGGYGVIPDEELVPGTAGKKDDRYQYNFLSEAAAKKYRTQRPAWANSTYDVFKETMQPLLTYLGGPVEEFTVKDHAFYAGENVEKSAIVVWDGPGAKDVKLKWRLETGGSEAASGEETLSLKIGDIKKQPIRFAVPPVTEKTKGTLSLEVFEGDTVVQKDSMELTFWPKADESQNVSGRWAVFDPEGKTLPWLEKLGVKPTVLTSPDEFVAKNFDVLVLGRQAMDQMKKQPFDATDIAAGLKVLVMEQSVSTLEALGFRIQDTLPRKVFIRDASNPLVNGLENSDFSHWRGAPDLLATTSGGKGMKQWANSRAPHWRNTGAVASVVMETPQTGAFTPVLECEFDLAYSPLLQWQHGKGEIVFCQLDLSDRVGSDPAATAMAKNLIGVLEKGPEIAQGKAVVYWGGPEDLAYVKGLGYAVLPGDARVSLNAQKQIVVVGAGAKELPQSLGEFVKAGGCVLMLPESWKEWTLPGTEIRPQWKSEKAGKVLPDDKDAALVRAVGPNHLSWRSFQEFDRLSAEGMPEGSRALLKGLLLDVPDGKGQWVLSGLDWKKLGDEQKMERPRWNTMKFYRQLLGNLGAESSPEIAGRLLVVERAATLVNAPDWLISTKMLETDIPAENKICPGLAEKMPMEMGSGKEGSDGVTENFNKVSVGAGEEEEPGIEISKGSNWVTFRPRPDGRIMMSWVSPAKIGKIGYARCHVYSSRDRKATFLTGADFYMTVLVNGVAALDQSVTPRHKGAPNSAENLFTAELKKGWNTVEIKTASGSKSFAFWCAISDPGDLRFSNAILRPTEPPTDIDPTKDLLPEPEGTRTEFFYVRKFATGDDPYQFVPW